MASKYTTESFVELAKEIHGDKYDYSLINYTLSDSHIKIICKKHGVYERRAREFIHPSPDRRDRWDCPLCIKEDKIKAKLKKVEEMQNTKEKNSTLKGKISPLEKKAIIFFDSKSIDYFREQTFEKCVGDYKRLPFDFYLPKYNLLIEINGQQHYDPTGSFFSTDEKEGYKLFLKRKHYDWLKRKFAKRYGFNYLAIPYWEVQRGKCPVIIKRMLEKIEGESNE